jgi:hypothetical protein
MPLLSVDDLRTHVTTALADTALQDLLDAGEQAITRVLGPVGPVSEMFRRVSGDLIMLSRRAVSITSVVEGTTTLAADDYELRSGTLLRRLSDGTNAGSRWLTWSGPVIVDYIPESDVAERQRALVQLVNLDLAYAPGVTSERLGDWAETQGSSQSGKSYEQERETILASLTDGPVMY